MHRSPCAEPPSVLPSASGFDTAFCEPRQEVAADPMSAYPEFELLAPPPPTFLSTSSPQRAQLPRFANVDEVVQFARGQVLARRDPVLEGSLLFVVIYIGLLVVLAISVVIRRLLNRNFWLFRIVRRPDGLLLVPHLHSCWSFMAGSFGFIFTVYNIVSLVNLSNQQPPKYACITLVYVWSPLYVGLSWMAWAAAVAGTQDFHIRIPITRRCVLDFRVPPWVANLIGIGVPLSCAVAIFFPVLLGTHHSENARRLYLKWNKQFSTQDVITEDMLIQLQLIWFQTIRHANYLAIAAMLWSVFASITLVIYFYFSIRLIRTLRSHLRKKTGKMSPIQNAMTMSMGIFNAEDGAREEREHVDDTVQPRDAHHNLGGKSAIASSCVLHSRVEATIEHARSAGATAGAKGQQMERVPSPSPVTPPSRPTPPQAPDQGNPASSVERAVLYFIIQATSLNLGTFLMVSGASVMANITVAQAELGRFQNTENVLWMVLTFTCVVFGTTTLCSIAHETYEESLASLIHPSRRSHTDSAPFRLSPVTISVVERRRRMPQHEIRTHELQTEMEHHIEDEVAIPGNLSTADAMTYNDKQHPSTSGELTDREGSLLDS
ncbi:unnamed protein product [Tilletia controversa]|uniref:Uncharacterized protein n=2 Tax=Tilletia TaxID=13289 RepID=A0A8X7MN66_9BASI|nr:hypothetical protein CF336_g4381 [Tilletia laevis]KAE8242405.1 hypothetical protein A4X06_0g6935 [Tilletia controversa]KAE8254216.1 hypothetical protein A4X03_0g5752 [Tilletia caries]CAD6891673.1 unnamed protein product [Tilletia caries]CAD6908402.1 unnamed protein product [Tilletia caries]